MKFIIRGRSPNGWWHTFYCDRESFSENLEEAINLGYAFIEVFAKISYKSEYLPDFEGWED